MVREQERISLGQFMVATLLLLTGALLFFYHLGKTDLSRETPARIAVYAREMTAQGQLLAPVVRGQVRLDVPPLYLWAVRACSLFSAKIGPLQERAPAACAAVALALLIAWWLYRHASRYNREDMAEASPEGFALLAGLILASNPVLFSVGRAGTLNTMFVFFYSMAAFCWAESLEARRSFYAGQPWRKWVLWGYALAGVAMLVRGPLVMALLWVPYAMAARSYHLKRIDKVHLNGLLLALLIGLSWPMLVTMFHFHECGALWREWLTLHYGNLDSRGTHFTEFLVHVLASSFPWNILALVLVVRVWLRKDRSPTLVFWMCSLVGNLLVLTFLSNFVGQHRLPVVVFISLMAADAVYRWNFENAWATAWRVLLRVLLVLVITVFIVVALVYRSNLGLTLFILAPLAWAAWAIRSRLAGMTYTPWETTLRLSAMVVFVFIAGEAMILSDYEPKRSWYDDRLSYFSRIKTRLAKNELSINTCFRGSDDSILYDYYLGVQPAWGGSPAALEPDDDLPTYLLADHDRVPLGNQNFPNLNALTMLWNDPHTQWREGMFRVLPPGAPEADSGTTETALRQPWRVALLGNQGTRNKEQDLVGAEMNKYAGKHAINDALLLGNNIWGSWALNQLDFVNAFEKPYKPLLKRGVTFHAALGREDQRFAWAQLRFPAFNMNDQRYYAFTTGPNLVDVFMLDGQRLYDGRQFDQAQLGWLVQALDKSRAPWKIVCLDRALASAVKGSAIKPELADKLLPILDRAKVAVVAWAGDLAYERLALPGHNEVFINAGWSGAKRAATLNADPRLKAGHTDRPGFVVLDFFNDRAVLHAVNERGVEVDKTQIPLMK